MVIVLVILIVFGPNRLPDLARKAGEFMSKVRNASSTMTDALGVDYEETVEPFMSAKRDLDSIKTDITKTVATFGPAVTIPEDNGAPAEQDEDEEDPEDTNDDERSAQSPVPTAEEGNSDQSPKTTTAPELESPDNSTAAS